MAGLLLRVLAFPPGGGDFSRRQRDSSHGSPGSRDPSRAFPREDAFTDRGVRIHVPRAASHLPSTDKYMKRVSHHRPRPTAHRPRTPTPRRRAPSHQPRAGAPAEITLTLLLHVSSHHPPPSPHLWRATRHRQRPRANGHVSRLHHALFISHHALFISHQREAAGTFRLSRQTGTQSRHIGYIRVGTAHIRTLTHRALSSTGRVTGRTIGAGCRASKDHCMTFGRSPSVYFESQANSRRTLSIWW